MTISRSLPVIVAALMLTANAAFAADAAPATDSVQAKCEKEFGTDAAKVKACVEAKGNVAK